MILPPTIERKAFATDTTEESLVRLQEALLSHALVADCAVVLRSSTANPQQRETVAYIVASGPFVAERLHASLQETLPNQPLPNAYVAVAALPLTPDGEVDVEALSHLEVIEADLLKRWEEQLKGVVNTNEGAVVVQEHIPTCLPLHLSDLLPSRPGSDTPHSRAQALEARLAPEERRAELKSAALSLSEGPPLIVAPDMPTTLPEALLRAVKEAAHKGIIYVEPDGTDRTQTYADLLVDAERILGGLRALGVQPGEKVLFQLEHNQDFISAFWGCVLGGVVAVPVSIAPSYEELNSTLSKLHNAWEMLEHPLILTGEGLESSVRSLSGLLHTEAMRVVSIETLRTSERDGVWHGSRPEDMAIMLLTSGSTGMPKGVVQRHSGLLARSVASAQLNGFGPDGVALNWFPMDHVGGIVMTNIRDLYNLCWQVHAPTQYVLQDPLRWLDLVEHYRVTVNWAPNFAFGLINAQAEEIGRRQWDLSSFRCIVNAGEAIVARTARRFMELLIPHGLPPTAMRPAWGMSETCSAVTYSDRFTLDQTADGDAFVEVGAPIPDFRMRIVDAAGDLVPEGKTGRLEVAGPSVTTGYYRNAELNAEVFTSDGWFNTGDLGMLREGRLTITGRQRDVIIINGLNFYSHELEAVVEEVSGVDVSYTAACGVRGEGSDTDELAIFFHTEESDPASLVRVLHEIRGELVRSVRINPKYLIPVPRSVIPKTQIGKIQRSALRERFEAGEFASILKQVDILVGAANTLPDWFYRPVWRRKVGNAGDVGAVSSRRTLVFVDGLGLGDTLCEQRVSHSSAPAGPGEGAERSTNGSAVPGAPSSAASWIRVGSGSSFCRVSATHYRIRASEPTDYVRLMESVVSEGGAVEQIIHLWTYAPSAGEPSSVEALEAAQEPGLYSLLFLVQALASVQSAEAAVRLLVVSSHTQATRAEDAVCCERTPLLGLVKAVSQEMPSLTCTHLDLQMEATGSEGSLGENGPTSGNGSRETNGSKGTMAPLAEVVLCELARTTDREVVYREGHRLVVRLEHADLASAPKREMPFQVGGIYLLTGGLGGIGVEVARHLLSSYQARLLLIGRAPLSEREQAYASLQSLESLGGAVRYEQVDVCDLQGLRAAVAKAQAQWGGALSGVLHLAGQYQASLIVEETRQTLASGMRAKLGGSWAVGELMKEHPEAMLIGFSSTTSFFDQAMFGAYAAGNRYLDSVCHSLGYGWGIRSVCLGWSAWDEIGMNRTRAGVDPIRATGRGFATLSSDQGIASLVACVYAGERHVLVGVDGSHAYIRRHSELWGEGLRAQRVCAYFRSGSVSASLVRSALGSAQVLDRFGTVSECECVEVSELPRTASGEIDREQLADWDRRSRSANRNRVAPRTDAERRLAEIWQKVLGVSHVGVYDNFFELGGHSLLATQVISRIRDAFEVDLPGRELFKAPTVAGLAERIGATLGVVAGGAPPLMRISQEGAIPLSFAQQRLWFVHQLDPQSAAYNISDALRLTGPLNVSALERSLQEIVRRHEALRTTFAVDPNRSGAEPTQVIGNSVGALEIVDLGGIEPYTREQETRRLLAEAAQRPFDLERGPLFRSSLLRLGDEEHVLLLTIHHIVSDGWSTGVLMHELETLYNAFSADKPSPLPELPIQYADYAVWQRDWLQGEALQRQLAYWKEHLGGAPALLELPTDRPRPPVQTFRGAMKRLELSAELTQNLKALGKREDTTLYMTLMAALQTLLSRYSGQEKIVVGTPIANRTRSELESLIGFFVNPLALHVDLSGDPSFAQLLGRVREAALGAYAHQDLPFEKIVDELQPERSLSYSVIFQVVFVLQNAPHTDLHFDGLCSTPILGDAVTAKQDLWLGITEVRNGLLVELEYNTDLFNGERMERLLGHFQALLESVAADPQTHLSHLSMLTQEERHRLLVEWNDTTVDYPSDHCIQEIFEEQVRRTPDALAVMFGDQKLTYNELNARANQVAHYLKSQGVGPEVFVGLCTERSLEMIVGLLGILKAGGAYVPLDPSYPLDRLAYVLEDSQVPVLLAQEACLDKLPSYWAQVLCLDTDWARIAHHSEENPHSVATSENVAYLIYTSGSTGVPKGVMVPHRCLCNLAGVLHEEFQVGPASRVLQFASLSFDASVAEWVMALTSGASLHLASREDLADAARLAQLVDEQAITTLTLPPSYLGVLPPNALSTVQTLCCAGEACSPELAARWCEGRRFLNGYGPTEATVAASYYVLKDLPAGSGSIPIGQPNRNAQLYLLDPGLEPVPVGVCGELYIGGVGVTRGYLSQAALTADRFLPNPFGAEWGSRMYRTGDLCRYLSDGNIEFVGRVDAQVKLRGFRIELGEIESVLTQHAGIREALVVVGEDGSGEKRLVAYLVGESVPDVGTLRAYLQEKLPGYMVPSGFVVLAGWPLTANGKVDRGALPAAVLSGEAVGYVAPRTPLELGVAQIWEDVLHVDRVGVETSFFELGGHSLLGTQVISRIRSTFSVELGLSALFEAPTVSGLACRIGELGGSGSALGPSLVSVSREGRLPLSFAQQRLWFLDQLEPGSALYNIPCAVRLKGTLDVFALEQSLNEIVRRHEVLRTVFRLDQGVASQVIRQFSPTLLPVKDLSSLAGNDRVAETRRRIAEEVQRSFDLVRGPLFRNSLLKLDEDEHILLVNMHHAVSDGWSQGVLMREIETLYNAFSAGKPSPLPELPIQYADYAVWQRDWLQGETLQRQISYWKEQLAGAPALLELPTDRPRPPIQTFQGATQRVELTAELTDRLKALGQQEDATLFMTLLAAFQILLSRYTSQDEIVVGTPIANRTRSELEDLIGFFLNTLALRGDLSGDPSFVELLGRVREAALGAYAHQDLPFEKLVEELSPERSLGHSPIFQVMLILQNAPYGKPELAGLGTEIVEGEQRTSKYDLSFLFSEDNSKLGLLVEYSTDLFNSATIDRMLGHFLTLLVGITTDPHARISRLPMLTEPERHQLLHEWNDTAADYPSDRGIHELFEEQVARTPDAIAVVFGDQQLTFVELNRRANQLAHYLRKRGVGPDVLTGLCVERSLEMVVGLFGILKAGGAYVPLDPSYPPERLAFMLEDAHTPLLLSQRTLDKRLPPTHASVIFLDEIASLLDVEPTHNPASVGASDHLAYVIYTSGSTGRPKGAMITHRGLVNYLCWCTREYRVEEGCGAPLYSSIGFDLTVTGLYSPLLVGRRVVLMPHESGSEALAEALLAGSDYSLVKITPAHLELLSHALPGSLVAGRTRAFIIGGEALRGESVSHWRAHAPLTRIVNEYGPTETVVGCCVYSTTAGECAAGAVPIGRPIANTQLYVLDAGLQPVPAGVSGELYVGGDGVGRGYLKRPELTAERFVPDAFGSTPGARLYRTGDLVRYLANGNLEYLGRTDDQVKVRGFRIELGEIESVLLQHASVLDAVVLAREEEPGEKRLVGYVVSEASQTPASVSELREHLLQTLPEYMVPSAFVMLEALPLSPNGKVDRKALPAPDMARPDLSMGYTAPSTPTEEALARIWCEVLRLEQVGIHDNFFELGGDSILSIQIIARANAAGLRLTPRQVFQHQSIASLASVAGTQEVLQSEQGAVSGSVPLTPIQRWFLEQERVEAHHFNQSNLLQLRGRVSPEIVSEAASALVSHHDALRLRFVRGAEGWEQSNAAEEMNEFFSVVDLSGVTVEDRSAAITAACTQLQGSLNLVEGPLLRVCYIDLGDEEPARLLIAIHHLGVDGVSWRVLLEDLATGMEQLSRGEAISLPAKTTSFQQWAQRLQDYANSASVLSELDYWQSVSKSGVRALPVDDASGSNTVTSEGVVRVSLDTEETRALLSEVPSVYHTQINDALLTALARSVGSWTGDRRVLVDLEGHGREALFEELDVSRTLGWFTSLYPVLLELAPSSDWGESLKGVKESLRGVPKHGLGYGVLRYLSPDAEVRQSLSGGAGAQISFNYHGQFDIDGYGAQTFMMAPEPAGEERSPHSERTHLLDVIGLVRDSRLEVMWFYNEALHSRSTVEVLAQSYLQSLRELIAHCLSPNAGGCTPSDFPRVRLSQQALDHVVQSARLTTDDLIEDIYPLSPMQAGMLFHSLYATEHAVYVDQQLYQLDGDLDPLLFEQTWHYLASRYAVMRTSVHWQGIEEPLQVVHARAHLRVELLEWSALAAHEQETARQTLLAEDRARGVDLSQAPLMRLTLLHLGAKRWQLLWTAHHLLLDRWSIAQILAEFKEVYAALCADQPIQLGALRPYGDYIGWLQEQDASAAQAYWCGALQGFTRPTTLPIARTRADAVHAALPSGHHLVLSEAASEALHAMSRQYHLTLNTVFVGAWALLLSRYSGEQKVLFGATVSGRPSSLSSVETMVGMFINSLPVGVSVEERSSVVEWLSSLQDSQLALRDYEYSSLVEIQGWSEVPRGTGLFESLVVVQNTPTGSSTSSEGIGSGGLDFELVSASSSVDFPLMLTVLPGACLGLYVSYDEGLYSGSDIARLASHLETLLGGMAKQPEGPLESVPLLSAAEREVLVLGWNDTAVEYPRNRCVHELFEEQVERTPDAVAVTFQDRALTYRELNARANQLARSLRDLGVGPEVLVGLVLDRSVEMMVAVLATLKAGGAYVPLDPSYPLKRLALLLEDAQPSVLLSREACVDALPSYPLPLLCLDADWPLIATQSTENLSVEASADNAVYISYTSGSTGGPKGVMVPHRAVTRLVRGANYCELGPEEVILQFAPLAFDASTFEIWGCLLNGGRLVIFDGQTPSLEELGKTIQREGVTTLWLTAGLFHAMVESNLESLCGVRQLLAGGDVLSPAHVAKALQGLPDCRIINGYGPTENTTFTCCHVMEAGAEVSGSVPIGRAISNTRVYVLDARMRPVPIGVAGELYAGGAGVARGYLNRADLTAERFVADPFSSGGRLYRTGDLARYLSDGTVEFLGRMDQQVKIRGFRIELSEIENALSQRPDIREAVVLAREDVPGDKRLVAYLVGQDGEVNVSELREYLRDRLPEYMIPSVFVNLETLPLTPNGKVDRRSLPVPEIGVVAGPEYVAPSTPVEAALAEIWSAVLRTEQIGVHTSFFELGGHSLLATQVISRVRETFQADIPLAALFAVPTIAGLAATIDEVRIDVEQEREEDLARLLAELDQLSDAEALALLEDNYGSS